MPLESDPHVAGEGNAAPRAHGATPWRRAHRHRLRTMALAALVLAGVGRLVIGHHSERRSTRPAAPVRTAQVLRRDMPVVEHTVGTVLANVTVQVTARVQGTLELAHFTEGQFVSKGQLLFTIDPRPFQAALAQARAVLERDEALLRNARRDSLRYQTLSRQNSISPQQAEAAATNVDVLTSTVAADRAAARLARLNLAYTRIRSPIDGKTGPLLVQPGNLVDLAGATPLVTIEQVQPVMLSFSLPERDLPRIQQRLRSRTLLVTLNGLAGAPQSAYATFVSNAVNTLSGTIELRATFPNSSLSLVPGQLASVTAELADIPHALVVPDDAVNDGPDGPYVYVVTRDDRAVPRPVRIEFDDAKNVAVSGNLQPGDQVIVEGQLRVMPGAVVQILPPSGKTAARSPQPG
ncbi:MAG: efflux RND transporter periplasmic adaptor subunit [Gammaproteobacteria bacterium]|nr:efflux RND transporter periplasmic adaptor subunit [Gammaproteobacteria bacterium]